MKAHEEVVHEIHGEDLVRRRRELLRNLQGERLERRRDVAGQIAAIRAEEGKTAPVLSEAVVKAQRRVDKAHVAWMDAREAMRQAKATRSQASSQTDREVSVLENELRETADFGSRFTPSARNWTRSTMSYGPALSPGRRPRSVASTGENTRSSPAIARPNPRWPLPSRRPAGRRSGSTWRP